MTSKEALKQIRETTVVDYLGDDISIEDKLWEEVEVLEQLVERDTPIKIKHEKNGIPYCSVCERSYLHDTRGNQNNFCGYCGQRLS